MRGDVRNRGPGAAAVGDQLCAHDRDIARGVDPQTDLPALESHDRHADVITDEELFHELRVSTSMCSFLVSA